MLDIYVVSLSSSWMNDSTLTSLMGRVPARCIVLLEDLDAAFTRSTSRDAASTGVPGPRRRGNTSDNKDDSDSDDDDENDKKKKKKKDDQLSDVNTLSLSGLLNALDGVAASEGRILFATTNHLERLDPALSRPGRMDVWVEFKNASPWQAEALFRNFFPSSEEELIERDGELDGVTLPSVPGTPSTTASSSAFTDISALSIGGSSQSSSSSSMQSPKTPASPPRTGFGSQNTAYMPPPPDPEIASASHSARPLDSATLSRLAKQFADSIPKDEFSVAALQGCKYPPPCLICVAYDGCG